MRLAAEFGRVDVETIKASSRVHRARRTVSANVVDWCEDSLELLELLCELAPRKRALIGKEGMRFFAWINYNRASAIPSQFQRIGLYYEVFRTFDYEYSPMAYLFHKSSVCRVTRWLGRQVKRLTGSSLREAPL